MTTAMQEPAFPIAGAPLPAFHPAAALPDTSTVPARCRLEGWTLTIAPLSIERHGQTFRTATELRIDLHAVEPGRYRVLAVHNFHVEDSNPRLDQCAAGVFLAARRDDGTWEDPERFPIECRALEVLDEIEVDAGTGMPRRGAP
jgi:hypothetical protein